MRNYISRPAAVRRQSPHCALPRRRFLHWGAGRRRADGARSFVLAFGATCISAAYRLAPEFKFPYAPGTPGTPCDGLPRARHPGAPIHRRASLWGERRLVQTSRPLLLVWPAMKLTPPLTGQYLAIPPLLPASGIRRSTRHCFCPTSRTEAVVLPVAAIDMFMAAYAPDTDDGVLYASFNHPRGHRDLPPALFQIDGMDPLRDDALIYERVLREEMVSRPGSISTLVCHLPLIGRSSRS